MAIRTILEFPDQRLRTRARPVTKFDAELGRLIDDMFETMYAAPGIGLAASQVDVHERVLVIDISDNRDQPRVFINPEILSREGEAETEEGCLSVPGIFDGRVGRQHANHYDNAPKGELPAAQRRGQQRQAHRDGTLDAARRIPHSRRGGRRSGDAHRTVSTQRELVS